MTGSSTPRASENVPSGTDPGEVHAWNEGIQQEFRANGGKVGGVFADYEMAMLTTTGAKSGRQVTTPILYYRVGEGNIMLIASNFGRTKHPAWYHNVLKNPIVTLETSTEILTARATITEGAERDRLFAEAVAQQPGYAEYQKNTDRVIPVVVLEVLPTQV